MCRRSLILSGWLFLVSTLVGATPPDSPRSADLVFYGDARGGVLQTFLGAHRPKEIHNAVARRIGSLEGLAEQRGIVFLGDAVSHGGCSQYWVDDFFPALRNLTAFRKDGNYLFYPVIGDHETFLIPEDYEELGKEPLLCVLFKHVYRAPGKKEATVRRSKVSKGLHAELTDPKSLSLPAQRKCPEQPPSLCANPGIDDSQRARCEGCAFQRRHCRGNCVTYTFQKFYSRENGFAPFQKAWAESPEGATWYKVDYLLTNAAGRPRKLRVLLLDTQAAPDLRARDGKLQANWMADRVAELEPGTFVVIAGHIPPAGREDLYEPILRAAFRRGVQVLAVVAAHYHGFASGTYEVSSDEMPGFDAQEIYFAISGDGGGRDLGGKEEPKEDRMVGNRIGPHLRLVRKSWTIDRVTNASSFVRLRVTYEGLHVTDYRVPLESMKIVGRGGGPTRRVLSAGKEKSLRSTIISRPPPP